MVSRHWLYFSGFVITGLLLVGAGLLGLLDGLSALSGGVSGSEELVLLTMLGAAAEWVVIVLVLGLIAALFLTASVVSVLRSVSLPRDDRLVSVVEWLERRYPMLSRFDVTDKVEPTTEDREQYLKKQYVAGEMTEAEFERQMTKLMHDSSGKPSQSENATPTDMEHESR